MLPNPPFVIAFVTIRFSFLSGQSYSKFRIVCQSSLKVLPRISFQILKFVRQCSQTEKLSRICRAELSNRDFRAEIFAPRIRRASRAEKSKLSRKGFCFVKLGFLSGKFSMNEKCRNILFVWLLPRFHKLNGNG